MHDTTVPRDPVRILLVDDHRVFADVLAMRLRLEDGVESVETAHHLDQALVLASRLRVHVVVLDHDLDGERGTDLVRRLDGLDPPPRVVMLSAWDDPAVVVDALRAGASGWVLKGGQVEELLTAIDDCVAGDAYLSRRLRRPVLQELLSAREPTHEPSFLDNVSGRQLDVLRCLVAGLSRAETGARLFISSNTVRTHVQNLLRTADVHSTLELVSRARRLGVPGIDEEPSP
ncbi:MAG: response regulator transcription factor [Nocardioidaceae bacterium]|nr:response regulator transcription factor [Nocardioidaceae bacterium]NUS51295.1 response regulator transcription factor [Nocardioidaceae bacterium]